MLAIVLEKMFEMKSDFDKLFIMDIEQLIVIIEKPKEIFQSFNLLHLRFTFTSS